MNRSDTAAKDVFEVHVQVQRQALTIDTVSTKVRNKNDKPARKQFTLVVSARLLSTFTESIISGRS